MSQFEFTEGSSISIPPEKVGDPIKMAFEVVSVDEDFRATELRNTGEITLSQALNLATKETGATSAWLKKGTVDVIELSHGRRPDSPHYYEEYGHTEPSIG